MVIGKLASGSQEDLSPPLLVEKEKKQPNGIKKNDPEPVEEKPKSIPLERKDSVAPNVVNVVSGVNGVETVAAELEDETLDDNAKGGGGGRWGALVKQRKADIIELVRT